MVIGNVMQGEKGGCVSDMCLIELYQWRFRSRPQFAIWLEIRISFFASQKFGAFGWLSTQKCPSGPSMGP